MNTKHLQQILHLRREEALPSKHGKSKPVKPQTSILPSNNIGNQITHIGPSSHQRSTLARAQTPPPPRTTTTLARYRRLIWMAARKCVSSKIYPQAIAQVVTTRLHFSAAKVIQFHLQKFVQHRKEQRRQARSKMQRFIWNVIQHQRARQTLRRLRENHRQKLARDQIWTWYRQVGFRCHLDQVLIQKRLLRKQELLRQQEQAVKTIYRFWKRQQIFRKYVRSSQRAEAEAEEAKAVAVAEEEEEEEEERIPTLLTCDDLDEEDEYQHSTIIFCMEEEVDDAFDSPLTSIMLLEEPDLELQSSSSTRIHTPKGKSIEDCHPPILHQPEQGHRKAEEKQKNEQSLIRFQRKWKNNVQERVQASVLLQRVFRQHRRWMTNRKTRLRAILCIETQYLQHRGRKRRQHVREQHERVQMNREEAHMRRWCRALASHQQIICSFVWKYWQPWHEKERMSIRIQTHVRQYLARRSLVALRRCRIDHLRSCIQSRSSFDYSHHHHHHAAFSSWNDRIRPKRVSNIETLALWTWPSRSSKIVPQWTDIQYSSWSSSSTQ